MLKSAQLHFALEDFSLGLDWSTSSLQLDPRRLLNAQNFNLTKFRGLEKRGGVDKLYATTGGSSTTIKTLYEYKARNGTNYVLVALGTKIRAYYSSAWNDLKTSLTTGLNYSFATHQGYCYGANGTDANFKLLNTTSYTVGIAAPSAAPTTADSSGSGLTGNFKHVYAYKRAADTGFTNELMGNYSSASTAVSITDSGIDVTVVASANTEVDNIVIYRTLDLGDGETVATQYYKVVELANSNATYEDTVADNDLTTLSEADNTVPPKAFYVILHKDRMFYANCPDEDTGGSLVMWSKYGKGEAVPSTNYQYFDREDGEDITGISSIGDYIVVFKKNKIAVIEGDFEQMYTISFGIGCIAPYAIISLEDKVVFISEEGWKAFDGANIYDLSKAINILAQGGWYTIDKKLLYSAVYYPEKTQMHFLMTHSTADNMVMVGHFLVPLIAEFGSISEQKTEPIVGWTNHSYPNQDISCFGSYTDTNGIKRIIAGDNGGFVYQLDTGTDDDSSNIECVMRTGWLDLGRPVSHSKTVRVLNFAYATTVTGTINYAVDTLDDDESIDVFTGTLSGKNASACGASYAGKSYCGFQVISENVKAKGTARMFRFNIDNNNQQGLAILGLGMKFRDQGSR